MFLILNIKCIKMFVANRLSIQIPQYHLECSLDDMQPLQVFLVKPILFC